MNENPRDLQQWLQRLEQLHPSEIDLGLERISRVAELAGLLDALPPIVTVGGTNGKGSVVEYLVLCLDAAGLKTGAYTSPHLNHFNERIRIATEQVSDVVLTESFEAIEAARQATAADGVDALTLTYFEFSTLAAMYIFKAAELDVIVLEVGLGGRLDAVNLWDASCAVITSIGVDHEEWLGSDRELIAREKVAIARTGQPLVIGERIRPVALDNYAEANSIPCFRLGEEFEIRQIDAGASGEARFLWQGSVLKGSGQARDMELPAPGLTGPHQLDNAAVAICVLQALPHFTALPKIVDEIIARGLQRARLPGRMQQMEVNGRMVLLDVAHNPAAAKVLAAGLTSSFPDATFLAVFAIMQDKDIEAVVEHIGPYVNHWHCASLSMARALSAADAASTINLHYPRVEVSEFSDVKSALQAALGDELQTESDVRRPGLAPVLVFGSFFTVSEALEALSQ